MAGTNGKGSVCTKVAKALQHSSVLFASNGANGYEKDHGNGCHQQRQVGLFTSPHIACFRERIQINSLFISEEDSANILSRIFTICETEGIEGTFFEITTALALFYFYLKHVDIIVLETGLGGRYDATNVFPRPTLSIISSIGLDHVNILGNTVEQIALQKGGIIKPNRPVLVGRDVPHDILRQFAQERNAPYYVAFDVLQHTREQSMATKSKIYSTSKTFAQDDNGAVASYDEDNSHVAEAAITLLQQLDVISTIPVDTLKACVSVRPPCRFEMVTRTILLNSDSGDVERSHGVEVKVVLDVAHNPPALASLLSLLRSSFRGIPLRFIVGLSSDKSLLDCVNSLICPPIVAGVPCSCIHLVEAANSRAATLEQLWNTKSELHACKFDLEDRSVTKQIQRSLYLAAHRRELLVICGSVFIMAECRKALGYDEPHDSVYVTTPMHPPCLANRDPFGMLSIQRTAN